MRKVLVGGIGIVLVGLVASGCGAHDAPVAEVGVHDADVELAADRLPATTRDTAVDQQPDPAPATTTIAPITTTTSAPTTTTTAGATAAGDGPVDGEDGWECEDGVCRFSEVGRLVHYLGEPTPLTEISGVYLETPGPAEAATSPAGRPYWAAGDHDIALSIAITAHRPDDLRSPEQLLADMGEGMALDDDEQLIRSEATTWMGLPAHDVEFTADRGRSLGYVRIIELADARVLMLLTYADEDVELDAIDVHTALVESVTFLD